jgi:hypothetical protein
MKTYTYSEARQQFAALLDEARRAGRVQIRRRDGQLFVLQPATQERSPLDVPGWMPASSPVTVPRGCGKNAKQRLTGCWRGHQGLQLPLPRTSSKALDHRHDRAMFLVSPKRREITRTAQRRRIHTPIRCDRSP